MLSRREIVAGLAATVTAPGLGFAQQYPTRPVNLLVAYAAGGGTDAVARIFASKLEERIGGRIIVENRPGAAGNLATEAAAAAPPDGHTLLIGNQGPMVVNPHLFRRMRADPAQTLEPIALLADAQLVVVVGPRLKVKTLPELVEEGKKRQGATSTQLVYCSASNASASHLAAVLLEQVAGFKARHVPYRGAGPALNDLVGGHVDFMVTTIPSVSGLIEGNRVTALAVTGEQRFATLPNIPTAMEADLKEYTASAWYGLFAPKKTPAAIVERLAAATTATLTHPDVQQRLQDDGATASNLQGEAFAKFMSRERDRWGAIVKTANITLE